MTNKSVLYKEIESIFFFFRNVLWHLSWFHVVLKNLI